MRPHGMQGKQQSCWRFPPNNGKGGFEVLQAQDTLLLRFAQCNTSIFAHVSRVCPSRAPRPWEAASDDLGTVNRGKKDVGSTVYY